MSLEDIKALPVADLVAPGGAHLYLWVTAQLNRVGEGVATAEAWGFRVHDEIVWRKPNLGMGVFPRHCHEILLVCRCGGLGLLPDVPRGIESVQTWRQHYGRGKTHSAKPPAALDLIERASPGPYVELFARRQRLGWDSWGYGYEGAA
jgi:N6-adenosine-specific RNA methylase IME4